MPQRVKSICRAAGCGALVDEPGFCAAHIKTMRQRTDERRGSAAERGYGSRWMVARHYYLMVHPLCVQCAKEQRVTAAEVVDHIVPHRLKEALDSGDEAQITKARALFWDSEGNWQSLCKFHHDMKTATQDGGFGRAAAR